VSSSPASPIRLLTAVPLCDGHDSAINTINIELVRHGAELIYAGYHRSVRDIVRAAVQEDVRAVGLSSYNGGHVEFFSEVVKQLNDAGASEISVFGGGGGTITAEDAEAMREAGVDRIFFAGTPLEEMVGFVRETYGEPREPTPQRSWCPDLHLARTLTTAASSEPSDTHYAEPSARRGPRVIGFTGAGGAGKTTLIDELVLRFLQRRSGRIAILSHDPSVAGKGALLGDRAAMIYSQDERVFLRSLATRGRAGGLAPGTEACLEELRRAEPSFDLVLIETVGIGQESLPFAQGFLDCVVLVMSPGYGGPLQLQKIAMLDMADIIVVNKTDLPGAPTALSEIEARSSGSEAPLIATTAKKHRDAGVDRLFAELDL
jgi:methylmalonyl-CoA mutase cobalamin-binding domain/chain